MQVALCISSIEAAPTDDLAAVDAALQKLLDMPTRVFLSDKPGGENLTGAASRAYRDLSMYMAVAAELKLKVEGIYAAYSRYNVSPILVSGRTLPEYLNNACAFFASPPAVVPQEVSPNQLFSAHMAVLHLTAKELVDSLASPSMLPRITGDMFYDVRDACSRGRQVASAVRKYLVDGPDAYEAKTAKLFADLSSHLIGKMARDYNEQ